MFGPEGGFDVEGTVMVFPEVLGGGAEFLTLPPTTEQPIRATIITQAAMDKISRDKNVFALVLKTVDTNKNTIPISITKLAATMPFTPINEVPLLVITSGNCSWAPTGTPLLWSPLSPGLYHT